MEPDQPAGTLCDANVRAVVPVMMATLLPTPPAPKVVGVGLVAAVVAPGGAPYQYDVQVPAWLVGPNGCDVVFAIEIPVSKPDWPGTRNAVVTYGNNSAVVQRLILRNGVPLEAAATANRGIVRLLEACPAATAENAPPDGVGA